MQETQEPQEVVESLGQAEGSKEPKGSFFGKAFNIPRWAFFVAFCIGIAGAFYYYYDRVSIPLPSETQPVVVTESTQSTGTQTQEKEASQKSSYTEDTSVKNQKRYTSPKLGVAFLYQTEGFGSKNIQVKEIENKIYVYSADTPYDWGQYVEIFSKDSDKTLVQALKDKLLTGYSGEKCQADEYDEVGYPKNFEVANISVVGESKDLEDFFKKVGECPSPYTVSNGISFFLMDKNYPVKFAFFSIGQYAISADEDTNTTWQDTFEFLD